MAVDPAMVGFNVVDNLQNTLLSYVMQNRQMEQQDRQFNAELGQREKEALAQQNRFDKEFGEGQRRFDLGEGRLQRGEDLQRDTGKANRAMFENLASYAKQRKEQSNYDRNLKKYMQAREDSPFSWFHAPPIFSEYATPQDKYRAEFEEKTGARPEPRMAGLPQFGQAGDILPTVGMDRYLESLERDPNSLLQMIAMQGG